jgi:predicted MPP superfamily phosphohydrolase
MKYWILLFFLLPLVGIAYSFWRTWQILPLAIPLKIAVLAVMALCIFIFFANFGIWNIDRMPMPVATAAYEVGNSSIFLLLYLVIIFLLMDVGRWVHLLPADALHASLKGTAAIIVLMGGLFTYGYFHYINKVRQPITLSTKKPLAQPLKIVMLSDLHIGYHNQVTELNRWIALINREKPDLILIGGDIIDGHIRPLEDQQMAQSFHRLTAPVVACLGNHEYYTGTPKAQKFYQEAGITLLVDSVLQLKGINVIGRDDRSNPQRKPLEQLMAGVDKSKYTIVLDHQPYHLEEAEHCGADFQLSGHTHYGQLWPISWIEDAMYEDAFGPLQKGKTQYYVTSGIGIWGGKFRIGTHSEYLVATLKN